MGNYEYDSLYKALERQPRRWVWTEILTNIAHGVNAPLRLLHREGVLKAWDIAVKVFGKEDLRTLVEGECAQACIGILNNIKNKDIKDIEVLDKDIETLEALDEELNVMFASEGCFPNPFLTLIRQDRNWCILERLKLLNLVLGFYDRSCSEFMLEGCFRQKVVKLDESLWLVLGPVWRWFDTTPDQLIDNHDLRDWYDEFNPTIGDTAAKIAVCAAARIVAEEAEIGTIKIEDIPEPGRLAITEARMLAVARTRAAIKRVDLEKRSEQAIKILKHVLNSQAEAGWKSFLGYSADNDIPYAKKQWNRGGAHVWSGLCQLAIACETETGFKEALEGYAKEQGESAYIKLPALPNSYEKMVGTSDPFMMLDRESRLVLHEGKAYSLACEQSRVYSSKEGHQTLEQPRGVLKKICLSLSRVVDTLDTVRSVQRKERLALMNYHMEDTFRLDEDVHCIPKQDKHDPNYIFSGILESLVYTLNADVATVFKYSYPLRRLQDRGTFYRTEEDCRWGYIGPVDNNSFDKNTANYPSYAYPLPSKEQAEASAEQIRKLLECARPEDMENSVSYRALLYSKITRYSAVGHARILMGDEDKSARNCVVVAPIRIMGRVWGVVEIRARFVDQLRSSAHAFLSEFCQQFSNFLMEDDFTRQMHQVFALGDIALNQPFADVSAYVKKLLDEGGQENRLQKPGLPLNYARPADLSQEPKQTKEQRQGQREQARKQQLKVWVQSVAEILLADQVMLFTVQSANDGHYQNLIFEVASAETEVEMPKIDASSNPLARGVQANIAWSEILESFHIRQEEKKPPKAKIIAKFTKDNDNAVFEPFAIHLQKYEKAYLFPLKSANQRLRGILLVCLGKKDRVLQLGKQDYASYEATQYGLRWYSRLEAAMDFLSRSLNFIVARQELQNLSANILRHEVAGMMKDLHKQLELISNYWTRVFPNNYKWGEGIDTLSSLVHSKGTNPDQRRFINLLVNALSSQLPVSRSFKKLDFQESLHNAAFSAGMLERNLKLSLDDMDHEVLRISSFDFSDALRQVEYQLDDIEYDRLLMWGVNPFFQCDMILIQQVLRNLLQNAFRYHVGKDPIKFVIERNRQQDLYIRIENTALPGIHEEFTKLSQDMRRGREAQIFWSKDGSGYGLDIVRDRLRRIEGSFAVNINLSLASRFNFGHPVIKKINKEKKIKLRDSAIFEVEVIIPQRWTLPHFDRPLEL